MPAKKDDKKEIKVAPLFRLTHAGGEEEVKRFGEAWQRSVELPQPVDVHLLRWVRVD